jgi:hypothetical protein
LFIAVDNSCCTLGATGTIGNSVASPDLGFILRMVYITTLSLPDSVYKTPPRPQAAAPPPVTVYPNPAHGELYVDGPDDARTPWLAQLYTMAGQLVLTQQSYADHFSIHIGALQTGVYILRLFNGAQVPVLTKKVLID